MGEAVFREAAQKSAARRRRSRWNKVVRALAAVVVFCTVYALVLPAITLGDEPICGIEVHEHTDGCWRTQSVTAVCPAAADTVLHTHDEGCYEETGELWCPLTERTAHLHTDECMEDREVLVCLIDEIEPHAHEAGCFGEEIVLSCGLEESEPHIHGDGCYGEEKVLNCAEEHDHEEGCYTVETALVCEIAETEGHAHSEDCYTAAQSVICGLEETLGHSHDESCYEIQTHVVCGLEQVAEHSHDEGCLDENGNTVCGITAAAVHIHDENCSVVTELAEKELICTIPEHIHTDECYPQSEAMPTESPFLCGMGEHTHGETCADENGEMVCTLIEHIHTAACVVKDYDGNADMETQTDWEASVAGVTLTGNLPKDILAIAESQLGYQESSRNVWLCEDGSLKGYTRYGAWYGVPYGDWCAMFVSFCVKYAGAVDVPMDSVCNYYIDKLAEAGMYRDAGYEPKPGDIIFFDWECTGDVDHTGLVAEIIRDENGAPIQIKTIEGNWENQVMYRTYDYGNAVILGYGEVPMGDGKVLVCEDPECVHGDDCWGFRLFFQGEGMEAQLLMSGVEEIPADLTLSILPVTEERDPMTYGAMNAAVELEMEQTPWFAGDVGIYQVGLLSNGAEFVLPEGATATVDVTFDSPVFDAADVAEGSGLRTFLLEAGEPITLFSGETMDTYEAEASADESYVNAAGGLTGMRLEIGNQRAFAVVLANTTLEGTFWTRVTSTDELVSTGTYMIVSAEGNLALSGNSSANYMWVELQTVKGNTDYYTITPRNTGDTISNSLYWTFTPNGSGYNIYNQGYATYLLGSRSRYISTVQLIASYARAASLTYVTPENCWRIYRSSTYLRNTGAGAFGTTTSADKYEYSIPHYYTRDMLIFKLSDKTSLDVPEDVQEETDSDGNVQAPEKPEYPAFIEPAGEKSDDTSLSGNGLTVKGKYYSDPATSDIEKYFRKDTYDESEYYDGMIRTDKSVIYGDDDYGAFENYPANTFGVTLSVLGQEYEMPYEDNVRTPIDVVFVLDVSGSMTVNPAEDNGTLNADGTSASRAQEMVIAVNKAIRQIMADHSSNRVGVVLYATGAWELLPLGRYVSDDDKDPTNDTYLQIKAITGPMQNASSYDKEIHFVETTASLKSESGTSYASLGTGFNQGYGTYTQAGIAMGGKTFADIGDDVEYTVSFGTGKSMREYTVNRQPVMILLSDGEPTHATNIYMDPLSGPHYGDGKAMVDNSKGIMGYNTILTANYFKRMIGIQYQRKALFYTVGMGINEVENEPLHGGETSDAYKRAVLNPTPENIEALYNFMDGGDVIDVQLKQLIQGDFTDKTVQVYTQWPDDWTGIPHIILPTLLKNPYADDYSYADGAEFGDLGADRLTEIFTKILQDSMRETPYGFILHESSSIELTDRIGEGMEIKGLPILRYQGVNYEVDSVVKTENDTRYIYKGIYTHPYLDNREYNLEDIIVHSYYNEKGHQVISMYVPDSVLPIYSPELTAKQFYYEMLPVRLIYQVGLTAASEQKVLDLYETGGTATFYTNIWEEEGEQSIANLYPSLDNPFYYEVLESTGETRYHSHHDLKTSNTTNTLEYIVDCSKRKEDVGGQTIKKVFHKLGNNGKLVFEVPKADIPVEKQWSGGVEVPEGTTIDVDLYQVQLTSTGKEEATLLKTVTLSAANEWQGSFENMPILESGYYAIAERATEDYQAQYSGETKTLVIDSQNVLVAVVDLSDTANIPTVVVTNHLKVLLPATGGMGTTTYYALGTLLVAAALVYFVGFGRLRRKEGS